MNCKILTDGVFGFLIFLMLFLISGLISTCLSFQIKVSQRWFIKCPLCNKLEALIFAIQGVWEACCFKPLDPHTWRSHHRHGSESQSAAGRWAERNRRCPLQSEHRSVCVCVCVWAICVCVCVCCGILKWQKGYQLCSSGGTTHGGGVETHLRESLGCWDQGCNGDPKLCIGAAGGHCAVEKVWGLEERGLLLCSLPSVMHLPSGWQQAWSGVRWSEHGLSGAVT